MSNAPENASSSALATDFSLLVSSTGSATGFSETTGNSTDGKEGTTLGRSGRGGFSLFTLVGKGTDTSPLDEEGDGEGAGDGDGVGRDTVAASPLAKEGMGMA